MNEGYIANTACPVSTRAEHACPTSEEPASVLAPQDGLRGTPPYSGDVLEYYAAV